jgi:hypothetical protein
MSAAEFSAALKNKAIASWFANEKAGGGSASKDKREAYALENVNVLVNPVKIYRSGEQTSEKTSFVITKDTVKDLIVQFHGIASNAPELDELTNIYFNSFKAKNVGVRVTRRKITVGKDLPAVFFPNISFESITNLVNSVLNIKEKELQKYYEKGHVVGLTTELLQETSDRLRAVDTTGATGKSFLLNQLDNVIAYYKRLDLASANLQPAKDIKLYSTYEKRASRKSGAKYLVELQTVDANQGSAKEIQATLGSIRKLFGSSNLSEKAIIELIDNLKDKVSDPKFAADLVEMRSSPSMKTLITDMLLSVLDGKSFDKEYSSKNVLIGVKKLPKVDTRELRAEAKKKIAEAKAAKAKIIKPVKTRVVTPNLINLQNLINQQLQDVISANMGDGNSRNVLNYRTGRLASSAKVEYMSESRAGLITAFYSYMKNPYATFSDGGKQSSPKSRDPKLLISKSIREIAATQVGNRLRAVNV